MKTLIIASLLLGGCLSPGKIFRDPRSELQPLNENADRLITNAEVHTEKAWRWAAGGFGIACVGFSPLAPLAVAYAAIPLFQMSTMEAGSAIALVDEARIANTTFKTAKIEKAGGMPVGN